MKPLGFKFLSGILVILIVFTIVITVSDNKKEKGNFRSILTDINTSDITGIEIISSEVDGKFSIMRNEKDQWEIMKNNERFTAQQDLVSNFLYNFSNISVKQVVANSSQRWELYHVNDSLGTRVTLYKGSEVLSDLIIGRIAFSQSRNPSQQYPDAVSYLRPADEVSVYSVDGMLAMTISRDANDFRDGHIVKCETENVTRIAFTYPGDSSFVLTRAETLWQIGDLIADSANTQNYLNNIRRFSNRNFEPLTVTGDQTAGFEMIIEGNNMETIKIKAFPAEENDYYVSSTINKETLFKLGNSEFERLFRGKSYFIP